MGKVDSVRINSIQERETTESVENDLTEQGGGQLDPTTQLSHVTATDSLYPAPTVERGL